MEVTRLSVDITIFHLLVMLDQESLVRTGLSDFALYLQDYEDEEAARSNRPCYRTRVQDPQNLDGLHDLFVRALMESAGEFAGEEDR